MPLHANAPLFSGFHDERVGVVRGDSISSDLAAANIEPIEVADTETGMKMLDRGRLDRMVGYRSVMAFQAAHLGLSGRFSYAEVAATPSHVCFSRSIAYGEELRNLFDEGLAKLRARGDIDKIWAKYE